MIQNQGDPEDTGNYISKYLQEKDKQKEKALEKEKQKKEREKKRAEKMAGYWPKDAYTRSLCKAIKDTRDLDTCPICMQSFQKVRYDMGDG